AVDEALLLAQREALTEARFLFSAQHHGKRPEAVLAHRLAEQEVVARARFPTQAGRRRQLRTGRASLRQNGEREAKRGCAQQMFELHGGPSVEDELTLPRCVT